MGFTDDRWHEWTCHTNFSFLTGASHPEAMVERAVELGYSSLGITDYDGVYGIVRAYRELCKIQKEKPGVNLKLHYGVEFHLKKDHHRPIVLQDTLILQALNHQGYFQLCELSSYAHRAGKTEANLPIEYLLQHPVQGLVAMQPMRGIWRDTPISEKDIENRLKRLKKHFTDGFYILISRHLQALEDQWIPQALAMASRLEIPVLFTQDVFFSTPEEKDVCDLLQAIRLNQPLDNIPEHLFVNSRRCLHSQPALEKIYSQLPYYREAVQNARELACRFDFDLSSLRYHYPKEMIPAGFHAQSFLEKLVWEKAPLLYPQGVPEKMIHLLKKELNLVEHLNFADYFLTVWDIVSWARRQDILCQGRGSAANSAICYILGITSVNPNQFDLLFERFISVERGDPPDIDVDFENARREEVIQYIYERYGRKRAAMVANVITLRRKGSLRFSGRALGIPDELITRVTRRLRSLAYRTRPPYEVFQQIRSELESGNTLLPEFTWNLWFRMAEKIRGFPRHMGIHSGGFILSDSSLSRLVPQEPATMAGRTVIQWSKDDIEALMFFKIDILALGMLTVIQKTFQLIQQHYGKIIHLNQIPADDPKTYTMIQQADTVGVFQIESPAQRASLPAMQPKHFYELVIQVAIIRPGPILAGVKHPYLRRRSGQEAITYPHPGLKPILERTFGTIIFQEQLMRVAMLVGNFTAGEANEIRKTIGSFNSKLDASEWIGKLVEGMLSNGFQHDFIKEVLLQIQGFASYGFPESHAASFALLAYASSWLKCHYPAAFFTALLNSQPMGFYQPDTLIKTAEQCGVSFLPLDINLSDWDHTLEQGKDSRCIRLGLRLIKGISKSNMESCLQLRKQQGQWKSLSQLESAGILNQKELSALASANALSGLDPVRRQTIWQVERKNQISTPSQPELPTHFELPEHSVLFPEETELESVETDYMATGTSLGKHLALLLKETAWNYPVSTKHITVSNQLPLLHDKSSTTVFGIVLVRQSPGTAKKMLFVTLEDEGGTVQVVIRPDVYRQYHHIIDRHSFLCIRGIWQNTNQASSLMATHVLNSQTDQAEIIPWEIQNSWSSMQSGQQKKARNYF